MMYFQVPNGFSSTFTVRNSRPVTSFANGRIFTEAPLNNGMLNISVEVPDAWVFPATVGDVRRLEARISGQPFIGREGDDALAPGCKVLRLFHAGVQFADEVYLAVDTL